MAVETAATEVLCLLAGCVVGELYGESGAGSGWEEGGMVGVEGVGGKAELGRDDDGGVLELYRQGVADETVCGDGVAVDGVLVIVVVVWEVVADIGEGGATRDRVGVEMLLLVLVPFGVVSAVVDVNVGGGVIVVGVVFVELAEEGVWLVGVGEPGGVCVDHEVGFLEDVGDRSDRDVVLWVDMMSEVGLVWRRSTRCGRSVREGRRGGISVELHRERRTTSTAQKASVIRTTLSIPFPGNAFFGRGSSLPRCISDPRNIPPIDLRSTSMHKYPNTSRPNTVT